MINGRRSLIVALVLALLTLFPAIVSAQDTATILQSPELNKIVPPGFYFQGLSAPTQMRNAAVVRFGRERYVIAGLVDTSGYAADIRAKYQGFLITDSNIKINDSELGPGAYGFGFGSDGKLSVLDLTTKVVLSVSSSKDTELKRPRPLMMAKAADGVRFYSGKDYVVIRAN